MVKRLSYLIEDALCALYDWWHTLDLRTQRIIVAVFYISFFAYAYTHGWLNLEHI